MNPIVAIDLDEIDNWMDSRHGAGFAAMLAWAADAHLRFNLVAFSRKVRIGHLQDLVAHFEIQSASAGHPDAATWFHFAVTCLPRTVKPVTRPRRGILNGQEQGDAQ